MSATLTKPMTADELLAMPDDWSGRVAPRRELIRMPPASYEHGIRAARLTALLYTHVSAHNLGVICGAGTGFLLDRNAGIIRTPDLAFISRERLERAGTVGNYWIGAFDLAVEVADPEDVVFELEEKVSNWLDAGVPMVWVISSTLHMLTVYHSLTDITVLTEKDLLDGGDVVPGFKIRLDEIFAS